MLRTLAPRLKEGEGGLPFHTSLEDVFFLVKTVSFGWGVAEIDYIHEWARLQNRLVAQVLTSLEFFVTVKVDVSSVSKSCVQ